MKKIQINFKKQEKDKKEEHVRMKKAVSVVAVYTHTQVSL